MIENKKGNPYHDESGKFTSKEGQGQGGSTSEEKVINKMGLNKEDTDKKVASDFAEILRKGKKIFFAGKSIDLNNVDEFTDVDGSLEEKMYDIVSRETHYGEKVKMPELDNIESGLDKIVASGKKIAEKYKQPKQEVAKPKLLSNEKYFKAYIDSINAHKKVNKVYKTFSSNEEMADSIAKLICSVYDEDFDTIKKDALTRLNKLDSDERETGAWKKAGYEERMFDTPNEIEVDTEDGGSRTFEVDWEDYANFMKYLGYNLDEEQLRNLQENQVLPYELMDEDVFEDFKEYITKRGK